MSNGRNASKYNIEYVLLALQAVLNWKVAIAVYVLKFILDVLPVLETIGNVIAKIIFK